MNICKFVHFIIKREYEKKREKEREKEDMLIISMKCGYLINHVFFLFFLPDVAQESETELYCSENIHTHARTYTGHTIHTHIFCIAFIHFVFLFYLFPSLISLIFFHIIILIISCQVH